MYDAYVEENYLALPEDTAQTVGRLAREAGLSSEMEPSWLAQEAVRFVQEDKRYDSQTPYQPENEDFVVYFLTHSQRGYCVHFASAVTVTLLSLIHILKDIAGKTKLVPETCDMLTVARRMGVSLG